MDAAASHLLDLSQPLDCALLDQIVLIAMDGANTQRQAANEFLVRIKDHPDMWKRVDAILESSQQLATRLFGLQVLSETIEMKWKIIPSEQREGIRNYIVGKIIALSGNNAIMKQEHTFLSRLNLVLVQILKQDWPHNWPTFISDIVMSSKTSETLCENNMHILKLLSEEVFDFSRDTMTTAKAKALKESLNEEFLQIFQLCEFILQASQKKSLILSTLYTLQRFLTWIPLGYIFETGLIPSLLTKFFPEAAYRTASLDCLTEIASLPLNDIPQNYRLVLISLLGTFVQNLQAVLPVDVNLEEAYEQSSDEDRLFIQKLALFLATFLRSFITIFEDTSNDAILSPEIILAALKYMILVSTVRDEEVFKTCLEFWPEFAKNLYHKTAAWNEKFAHSNISRGFNAFEMYGSSSYGMNISQSPYAIFDKTLHDLRIVFIDHMAKPEEVIIVEDENGEIVREMTKDTEVIAQYNTMHETLVFLTNLNSDDTQAIMLDKLDIQVSGGRFTWQGLNTLCWAIGSVSGAMAEAEEKRFLVSVIKDLLKLCEEVRGKENKAVVASNIMYIVGQYPRFLRAHWKFLKTVVNKLFEFMHEYHPGVQDMACDTFLKIASKCKRKFMTIQAEETVPFIVNLINDLPKHMVDLQPHQIQSFYESVGTMLSDTGSPNETIPISRNEMLLKLMESLNLSWKSILASAANTPDINNQQDNVLLNLETVRELQRIFKVSNRICAAVGTLFIHQLSNIFLDALQIYRYYSQYIINSVILNHGNQMATKWTLQKALRHTKSEFIELLTTFFTVLGASYDSHNSSSTSSSFAKSVDKADVNGCSVLVCYNLFLPGILSEILTDYKTSPTSARDSKILFLLSTAIKTFRDIPELSSHSIPQIMNAIFESTLELITTNMSDHPDHRIGFFAFLRNANNYCFHGLFHGISSTHQKLLIDSILWAIKHTERNVSEMGLEILYELLTKLDVSSKNLQSSEQQAYSQQQISQGFYSAFLITILQEIFSILTDRLHKSGFKLQVMILKHLFHNVIMLSNMSISFTLTDRNGNTSMVNSNNNHTSREIVYERVNQLLGEAFPNLSKPVVSTFLTGCFDINKDIENFKDHVRDFLICCKEFEAEDNSDLYLEEKAAMLEMTKQQQYQYKASIPGLLKPDEVEGLHDLEDGEFGGSIRKVNGFIDSEIIR